MMQEPLQQRRTTLLDGIRSSEGSLMHSDAWLTRVLGKVLVEAVLPYDRQAVLSELGGSDYERIP